MGIFGKRERRQPEYLEAGAGYPLKRLPAEAEREQLVAKLQEEFDGAGKRLYTVSDIAFSDEDGQAMLRFHCRIDVTGHDQSLKDTIVIVLHDEWVKVVQRVMPGMLLHHE